MMKIITLCGSMQFKNKMIEIAAKLELEGNIVIQCIYFPQNKILSNFELELLSKLHYKKIEISDAFYIVNGDGYIGEATKNEIEYTRSLNKEILSLEPLY